MDKTPTIALSPSPASISIRHLPIKRIFDLGFCLSVLVIGAPIFFLVAFFVWTSSKGPVLYAHYRIGRGGKPFLCYKFRTMHIDADDRLNEVLNECPERKEQWETKQKLDHDPRVTPIGQFLRKTSLDELPQFWNVLKGDLSVVGPRPVLDEEVRKHYKVKAAKILSVRPGITGLWQVSGRSSTCYEERIEMDEEYIEQRSLLLDLKLILKTLPAVFSSRGAC